MNYENLKKELSSHERQAEIDVYFSYLKKLEVEKDMKTGDLKNKWFQYFTEKQAADLFKKVAIDNLFIDGDTITLQFKGSVMLSYNYQAYKNKLLNIYPETLFDIQNVHEGDIFNFKKESGKVVYSHEITNPFNTDKKIIGCYCIIKNSRGEFIETLNMDDIKKMRAVAKTDFIWKAWEGEMILKSVIKRACKRHFKDLVVNIEKTDNEDYDLEKPLIIEESDENAKTILNAAKTLDELKAQWVKLTPKEQRMPTILSLKETLKTTLK